jgi:hypothetical protein
MAQWVIFNTVDVSIFDLRVNTISWLLFSALWGVTYHNTEKQLTKNHQ